MIEVEALVYDYPGARALGGVDLTVEPGQVTALVGPNGAGKTTLLRCLAALERPTEGAVRIGGVDTAKDPRAVHAMVGFLPDFFGLYDELTARQCLTYAAASRGTPQGAVREAVERAAERTEIADRLETRAGQLSRGLRQRLAIAQAIVHGPMLALLDEPAAGLDPEARASLSGLIRRLADDGATVVVSSHILSELDAYSDQMVMMREGRIAGAGPVARAAETRARARFAAPPPDLAERLAAIPLAEVRGDEAVMRLADREAGAAALIRALVEAGLPLSGFAVERDSLESAYLAEVRSGDGEGRP